MNPKNVLFVTYYWPPAGGAAVNRTLKFQKYLHQYGWNPIILTVKDGDYPSEDPSLLHEVDSGTHVFTSKNVSLFAPIRPFLRKGGYLKPRAFANSTDQSLKTRILRFFKFNIIPDTRIGWRLTAVKKGMELIQSQNIDLIYSTSPPQ
ncbi:MAG: glycosyl transferase family 1, partial [Bacteroidetes bacterium]